MIWFKRPPNVAITQKITGVYGSTEEVFLVRSFRRSGKLWCIWRGEHVLLKNDGTCVGTSVFPLTWEAL